MGLLILASVIFARAPASYAARFGAALMICAIGVSLAALPEIQTRPFLNWIANFGANLTVPLFWLFARAWFDDAFRPKLIDALAPIAYVSLGLYQQAQASTARSLPIGDILIYGLGTTLAAHALWLAWRDHDSDLVEPRRRARAIFVVSAGLVIFWSLWSEAFIRLTGPSPWLNLVNAAIMLALGLAVTMELFGLRQADTFPGAKPTAPLSTAPEAADPDLARRLDHLIAHDRLYRSPDLTIGVLAVKLGVPEYRVRRLINGALGFRNFNEYLNAQRLMDVRQALSDANQTEVPILTIAMDAGFGSLAAFNRSFKAAMGETPTDFRRRAAISAR